MNIEIISSTADVLAIIIGSVGGIIITIGSLTAVFGYTRGFFEKHDNGENIAKKHIDPIRVEFGRYINFGLEFFIAKDVLETMFSTTWTEIGQLFVIVLIRTVVSYFLIYEINEIEARGKGRK